MLIPSRHRRVEEAEAVEPAVLRTADNKTPAEEAPQLAREAASRGGAKLHSLQSQSRLTVQTKSGTRRPEPDPMGGHESLVQTTTIPL